MKRKPYSQQVIEWRIRAEQMIAMRQEGRSYNEIARKFRCSTTNVRGIIERYLAKQQKKA